jgi:hypothetical protein
MNKFEFKNLTPFKWFVLENFPFIEADFDALTEWQLFCKLGKEMNKIINSENTLGTQVENVTNAFIELQNYVNNYFKNLDVQEEINNKLNEMAEDGTLQEIITEFLKIKSLLVFDNVNEMKLSTNLINGSYAKTLGFYNKNDFGGNIYKIRNKIEEDIIDDILIIEINQELVAELILDNIMSVEQFGAYGNNEEDDTLSIQLAINNCKKVLFNKTYKTTSQITINTPCELIGNGTSIINSTLSGKDDVFKVLTSNVNFLNLEINLQYNGGGVHGEHGATICFGTYKMDTPLNISNFIIRNCRIKRQGTLSENIAIFGDTHNVLIENCYIYGECITLHWSGDFDERYPNTGRCSITFHPYNVIIRNNILENNRGVFVSSAYNVEILNNTFINNTFPITFSIGDYGNTFAQTYQKENIMTGLTVENCNFTEYEENAIYITGYGYREDDPIHQKNYITNSKINIKNCSFEDSTLNPNKAIVNLILAYGINFNNCKFKTTNRKNAIYGNPFFDTQIENCYFSVAENPISIFGGNNIIINNCIANINNKFNFIRTNQYTFNFTETNYKVENLTIKNNICSGITTLLLLQYVKKCLIDNNKLLLANIGIQLSIENENITISNNKFTDNSETLIASHFNIKSDFCKNLIVLNNNFNGARGVGINTNSLNNRILHNNLIENSFTNALLVALTGNRSNKDVFLLGNITDDTSQLIYGTDYQYINYTEN